ncbi:MAG: aminopeptidase P family protein [Candidatus Micrarchaeota archaeon]|nr:aminopeptidase P family protein [Candidatus Micrarchaeota archaeon]MDE1823996.1 aminopeptidase P family protein [Candidatus Micrarchaeota archaeon]
MLSNCKGASRMLIINTGIRDPNFTYMTGFASGLFEGNSLIISRKRIELLTNSLEYEDAMKQRAPGLRVVKVSSSKQLRSLLSSAIKGRTIGINEDFLPASLYGRIRRAYGPRKLVDASGAFSNARMVKDQGEIDSIRKAARITKAAMVKIRNRLREGMTEKELAAEFDYISSSLGSEGPSFSTIACFGKNSSMPHHMPGNTRLRKGDFILIDAGARVQNYCSDITRTMIFKDNSNARDHIRKAEMYGVVKEAQRIAISMIKEGVVASKVDKAARDYIDGFSKGRYRGRFIHSLGHSLGLEVHDGNGLAPGNREKLKAGTVVTVEPGVYVPGFGGVRIEDDVVVRKHGAEIL